MSLKLIFISENRFDYVSASVALYERVFSFLPLASNPWISHSLHLLDRPSFEKKVVVKT
jgi:hypothetical protein